MTETQDILIETFEFERALATSKDEVRRLKFAIQNGRSYTTPEGHDPIKQFMVSTDVFRRLCSSVSLLSLSLCLLPPSLSLTPA